MIDLHKHWSAKKDLAEKLYKNGVKIRHAELSAALKEKVERTKEKFVVYAGRTTEQLSGVASKAASEGLDGDQLVARLKASL